jgi:predicted small integral membrane protein
MTAVRAVLVVVAATVLTSCAQTETPSAPASWETAGPTVEVRPGAIVFEVTGRGAADTLSYGAGMVTTTLSHVQLPWSGTVSPGDTSPGLAVTVQAQLPPGGGQVSCRISRDNQELVHASTPGGVLCTAQVLR